MSTTAEEAPGAAVGGEEPTDAEPAITREELIDAIVAELGENPDARDRLIAEIYIEASSHRQLLEQIAGTMSELLADPKRIVRAFFGRGRRHKGDATEFLALATGEPEEEGP